MCFEVFPTKAQLAGKGPITTNSYILGSAEPMKFKYFYYEEIWGSANEMWKTGGKHFIKMWKLAKNSWQP